MTPDTQKRERRFFNPMNEEDRGCLCKRQFETKEECERSIAQGGKPFGVIELRAYRCKFCRKLHKTKYKQVKP